MHARNIFPGRIFRQHGNCAGPIRAMTIEQRGLIRLDQIAEAYLRVENRDVRYRFAIDLAANQAG